jgi:hypothetical protein
LTLNEKGTYGMTVAPEPAAPLVGDLELAADQAIAACGGDAREAVKALIVANGFLEVQVDELRAAVSTGYSRGRYGESGRKEQST